MNTAIILILEIFSKIIEFISTIYPLLLPSLCIISLSIFNAILMRKKASQTFFLSTFTIVLILFVFGLLNFEGSLLLAYSVIVILSIVSLIFSIKKIIRKRSLIKEISLIPSLFLYTFLLAISLFLNYERMFWIWDEFSFWGTTVKALYVSDALATHRNSTLLIKNYIPGFPLLQYFWTRPFSEFLEYPAYIASNMLFFSIILAFIKKLSLKNSFFFLLSLLIPLVLDNDFFSSLYVDSFLGILFGLALLCYFYLGYEKSTFGVFMLLATIGMLTLTKDIGLVFSGIAIIIVVSDFLLSKRKTLTKYFYCKNVKPRLCKKSFLLLLSPLFLSLCLRLSWQIHLKILNISSTFGSININSMISSLINKSFSPVQYAIITTFKDAIVNWAIYPSNLPFIKILLALIIIIILLIPAIRGKNINLKTILVAFSGIVIGNFVYIGILLLSYLYIFSEREALILASYHRYMSSYIIGVLFFLLLFIISKVKKDNISRGKIILQNLSLVFSTLAILFIINYFNKDIKTTLKSNILDARQSVEAGKAFRSQYNVILNWSEYFEDKERRLYIISQGDYGVDKLILMHTIYPSNVEWIPDYSVSTEPYHPPEDIFTKIISPDDWENYVIANYDLLYLHKYDENFIALYGHFFDNIGQYQLYEVKTDEKNKLELILLPN